MSDGFESLFDNDFCIDKPIRLIELFGGIGSQAMALRDIGADFEHYRLVEFDKYACASYNAIHGTSFEPTDIRNVHGGDLGIVEKERFCYLLTYSFPCTDLSVAGKMKGMSKEDWKNGKSTRSGLLWDVERILKELSKECIPDILLMENVPQVHAKKNLENFESWKSFLRSRGYQNFCADLNANDFGIPQNRNRCFMVSILSDEYIDFEFPTKIELETVMKDYLEDSVDEKYYINTGKAKELVQKLLRGNQEKQICVQINYNNVGEIGCKVAKTLDTRCKEFNTGFQLKNGVVETIDLSLQKPKKIKIAHCISARNDRSISNLESEGSGVIESWCVAMRGKNPERPTDRTAGLPTEQRLEMNKEGMVNTLTTVQKDNLLLEKKIQKVGQISSDGSQCGTVISENGLSPTLSAGCHGYANAHICVKENGFFKKAIETARKGNAETGDIIDAYNGKVIKNGISPTITTRPEGKKTAILPCVENKQAIVETQYRIRKLTPRECWRLRGYTDEDFDRAAAVNSNTELYKEVGNAIVKQVLMAIFLQMKLKMREQK